MLTRRGGFEGEGSLCQPLSVPRRTDPGSPRLGNSAQTECRKFRKARILSSNPCVGVNRARAFSGRLGEKRAEGHRKPRHATHRDSPRPRAPTGAAPQVIGYVEEKTTGSRRHTKGADVNYWGKQIRVEMNWLLR